MPIINVILCLAPPAALANGLPESVRIALQKAEIPIEAVGAYVQQVDSESPIVAINATRPMNPASVMKLVTTYAALELLGPTFTWKTSIHAAHPATDGVINGDMTIKGGGDPKLTIENFWLLVRSLRGSGVHSIVGDLIFDASYFDAKPGDPGAFDREPLRPYNVLPHALLVNFKAVKFQFTPAHGNGLITVTADPNLPQLQVIRQLRTTGGPCGDWRQSIRAHVDDTGGSAKVIFTGAMPRSCGQQTWYLSMLTHPSFVYGAFKSLWEEMGGTLSGQWRTGQVDPAAHLLAASESLPLADVVRDINKLSNNVMARHLFLTLSAEPEGTAGSEDRSAQIISAWLESKGMSMGDLAIENGSGLSRSERISAQSLGRLLIDAYSSTVMPEFMASLPLVAVDGTMRNRLRRDAVAGQAHIKTGGLNQVSTIGGYVRAVDGRRFAVAFLVNHANAARSGAAQDALLRWVNRGADQIPVANKMPARPANAPR